MEKQKILGSNEPSVTQNCRGSARERLSLGDLPQGALRREQVVIPEALLGQEPSDATGQFQPWAGVSCEGRDMLRGTRQQQLSCGFTV